MIRNCYLLAVLMMGMLFGSWGLLPNATAGTAPKREPLRSPQELARTSQWMLNRGKFYGADRNAMPRPLSSCLIYEIDSSSRTEVTGSNDPLIQCLQEIGLAVAGGAVRNLGCDSVQAERSAFLNSLDITDVSNGRLPTHVIPINALIGLCRGTEDNAVTLPTGVDPRCSTHFNQIERQRMCVPGASWNRVGGCDYAVSSEINGVELTDTNYGANRVAIAPLIECDSSETYFGESASWGVELVMIERPNSSSCSQRGVKAELMVEADYSMILLPARHDLLGESIAPQIAQRPNNEFSTSHEFL